MCVNMCFIVLRSEAHVFRKYDIFHFVCAYNECHYLYFGPEALNTEINDLI